MPPTNRKAQLESLAKVVEDAFYEIKHVASNLRPYPTGEYNDTRLIKVLDKLTAVTERLDTIIDEEANDLAEQAWSE